MKLVNSCSTLAQYKNRPFQGYRRHIVGGAKLLGRARGRMQNRMTASGNLDRSCMAYNKLFALVYL